MKVRIILQDGNGSIPIDYASLWINDNGEVCAKYVQSTKRAVVIGRYNDRKLAKAVLEDIHYSVAFDHAIYTMPDIEMATMLAGKK